MPLDPAEIGRLRDMIDYAEEAIQLLGVLDADQFQTDRRTFLAVSRCVQVVGEASYKISDTIKAAHPEIPWPLIAGMRHRLVHDYGRVDYAVVHRVISVHLRPLMEQLQGILAQDAGP